MKKYYAGIGSRQTPYDVMKIFRNIAKYLEENNYILTTGDARGADLSFVAGVSDKNNVRSYIPYRGYNGSLSERIVTNLKSFEIAKQFHPSWSTLSLDSRLLHARNAHIVLGENLDTPVEFIVCWTKNGECTGGTGQALRMAEFYNVPVFNFGKSLTYEEMLTNLLTFVSNAY